MNLLYGELAQEKHSVGTSQLYCKDVCKKDLRTLGIKQALWEAIAFE